MTSSWTPVHFVSETDSVLDAARLMTELDVELLPVVDGDRTLKGVVVDHDIVAACVAHGEDAGSTTVRSIMRERIAVDADLDLAAVPREMAEHATRTLPVVDDGRLVGVLKRGEVALALAHLQE